MREVIEEIVDAGQQFHFGLEAGSKPELVAALAMHQDAESLIICNGYKDAAFIRIALLGCKLSKKVVIVAEKLEELFPYRPEVIDPLKVAKKLPRIEHRLIALRRAVECVINNLLIRNMPQGEKAEFQ